MQISCSVTLAAGAALLFWPGLRPDRATRVCLGQSGASKVSFFMMYFKDNWCEHILNKKDQRMRVCPAYGQLQA